MNIVLARSVRFCLTCDPEVGDGNSWAGAPTVDSGSAHMTLTGVVKGPVDPETGYVCNIKLIDRALRDFGIPVLLGWCEQSGGHSYAGAVAKAWRACLGHAPEGTVWHRIELAVTPYLTFGVSASEANMVEMTYSFEFSAAHRLHCASLSEAENDRVFGKCANPNGHGHNYVLEVTVVGDPDEATGAVVPIPRFEREVNERIIERFDHKHLNLDCPEFAEMNPTVENITRVIHDRLEDAFIPAKLARVRVYETPKTYAEYPLNQ
jgi:6-pyruvoyltetrahydropterin/6-carboxytetrahydropterin synthase